MSFGQFQFRRGTAAQWTSGNPTLLSGEFGLETDTSLFKIGDGTTAWISLGYGGLGGAATYTTTTANFTTPAVNSNVTIAVGNTGFMSTNTPLFIAGAGAYTVVTVVNTVSVTVKNTGATGNAAPSTVINSGALVAAAGVNGVNGTNGTNGAGVAIGGTTGQALTKNSATDYDTGWTTVVPAARTIATTPPLTGGGDLSANRTLALTTSPAGQTPVGVTRTLSTTAPLTIGGGASADLSADRTLAISAATTSAAGSMSANDKKKVDNMYYDVTNYGLVGDDATDNVTAWNALYAILPVNAVVFFPPGTYRFASELTLSSNLQLLIKGAGKNRSILKTTTSTTAHLFRFSIAAYYYAFEDLGFTSNVTKTAGAAIHSAFDNALMDIRRCDFQNQFIAVDWSGVGSGNVGSIVDCNFTNPRPNGFQIRINGANINTMIYGVTVNCTGISAIGIEINQSGAVQITECDIIGGTNCLRVNATGVVSAIYCTNVFFDQCTLGSTVKFMGTFAASRIKFTTCGITNGAAGLPALEIAGTGSGTGIPEAIDFLQCDFYNNGFGGTTTGLLITGVRGIDVRNCRIAGFTVGIDITPYSANGVTNFGISGNTIGPTENFAGNATGIRLNANGAITYGKSHITNNDLSGNTTAPLTVGSTVAFENSQFFVKDNIGLATAQLPLIATPANPGAVQTILQQIRLDANSLQKGTTIKFKAAGIITATAPTITARVLCGAAGTIADAVMAATPAVATATGTGWDIEMYFTCRAEASAATPTVSQGHVLGTAPGKSVQAAAVNVAANGVLFISFTIQCAGTTPVCTITTAFAEVIRQ